MPPAATDERTMPSDPSPNDPGHGAALARVSALPLWRGPVAPEPLPGGLSNRNFVVCDGGERYVVRLVDGDVLEHGIVREREIAMSRAAFAAGIAPELVFADGHVLVLRHVDGRTLTEADVREPAMLDRIAALLRHLHRDVAGHLRGPAPFFWVFHAVRDYLARLEELGRPVAEIARLRRIAGELERPVGAFVPTATHNDLMPGNLIDDGTRLWLIDWEYAGYGAPLFDLATLVVDNGLAEGEAAHVLAAYHGAIPDATLRRSFAAIVLAAALRESLWARVQESHGRLAFDYRGYGDLHEGRFEAGLGAFLRER